MVAGFVLLIIVSMKLFPELPVSRLLHHSLVEAPLRKVSAMGRQHLIYTAVLVAMMFAGTEILLLLGSADMIVLLAWDVSLYVDAVIAAWTLSAFARGNAAGNVLTARVTDLVRRMSRPRTPRHRRDGSRTAANDADDEGGAWARALAA